MIIAIIPIKHRSQRLPGKNFKLTSGKPLYHWILDTLISIDIIDRIIIETDSPVILDGTEVTELNAWNDKVKVLKRPLNLCAPEVSTNLIIKHVISELTPQELEKMDMTQEDFDNATILQTHVTNPCLTAETIKKALQRFGTSKCTSLFSVTQHRARFWSEADVPSQASASESQLFLPSSTSSDFGLQPLNHDLTELLPTQRLKPLYEENSCFYIFNKAGFVEKDNRISSYPEIFIVADRRESYDIDYEEDRQIAELALLQRNSVNYRNYKELRSERELPKKLRQKCLITGAAGGLGLALSQHFQRETWNVYETDLEFPVEKRYGQFICDLAKETEIDKLVEALGDECAATKFSAVVLNAAHQECYTLCETPKKVWDTTLAVNLTANYLLVKALVNADLLEQDCRITIIGSVHSQCTSPGIAAYSVSKAALVNLTRVLALELGPRGIVVNCLHPGAIKTPMLMDSLNRATDKANDGSSLSSVGEALIRMAQQHPLGRVSEPEDICKAVYFLSTNESSAFHGSNLIADGGVHACLATE